jgi:hypothetical protein
MSRPFKEDKKTAISLKLPPYLLEWLDRQPESRAILIESALCGWYQIPDSLKPEPAVPVKKAAPRRSRTEALTDAKASTMITKIERSNATTGKKTD